MFRSYRDTIRTPVKVSKETAKKYFCDLCDDGQKHEGWDLELDVEIHRRRVHKEELIQLMREPRNFMCSVCLRQQSNKASLVGHIKRHHLLTPPEATCVKRELFICDYCNKIFFNKLLLIAHIRYFHLLTSQQKRMTKTECPSCNKHVNVRSIWFHFLYHGIIHTGTCPICLSTFEDYSEALQHIDTHPGYYSCSICPYEAKKENLFQNHMEKHKKLVNVEGRDDVNLVTKYFVPSRRQPSWSRKFVNFFKGITLAPQLQICVLCRKICETELQMLEHIYGDHSPVNEVEVKRHICVCGEEFFNNVLLKHHIFTLKGDHKALNEPKRVESPTVVKKNDIQTDITDHNIEADIIDQDIGIEVEVAPEIDEINDVDNCNEDNDEVDEKPIVVVSLDDSEQETKNDNDSNTPATETEMDSQTLYVAVDNDKKNINRKSNDSQQDNTVRKQMYLTVQNSEIMDKAVSNMIRKSNEVAKQATNSNILYLNVNSQSQVPQKAKKTPRILRKNNETIKRLVNPASKNRIIIKNAIIQNRIQRTVSEVSNQRRPVMLNRYVERAMPNMAVARHPQATEQIHYVPEPAQEAVIYEVMEVAGEVNADGERIIEDSALIFS